MILTTGTFISGRLVVGDRDIAGRARGRGTVATALGRRLRALGITVRRLKTGTPPRIDARTVDFSRTSLQLGSPTPL